MSHIVGRKLNRLTRSIQANVFPVFSTPKPAFYSSEDLHASVTPESDPAKHTLSDVGSFYKIDNAVTLKCLFKIGSLQPSFIEECKTFNGTYIMIRKPALEIINYMKHSNYDYPINKYVLFGKRGYGVSMTMSHIVHYAYFSGWLIVHIPSILYWLTVNAERVASSTNEALVDIPIVGSDWLMHFRSQNLNLMNKYDLRLHNDYIWNVQEENKKGDSLLSLVEHGINRTKYSFDVIKALFDEVKFLSKTGIVKTLVAIDNYSVLFHPAKKSTNKKFKFLAPRQLSITESIKNLTKADWHNGAVVISCFSEKITTDDSSHLPLKTLTLEGFELLDPFIPIEVPQLTDMEMTNLLEFYRSQKWLLTSEGDEELKTISGGNIAELKYLCGYV